MNARSLANKYKQTGASSATLDASPHQLIAIMLSTARERIRLAIASLERGDVTRKAHAITDTCAIIGGLNGSLNMDAGGEIAAGLAALYDYCQRRLLAANLNNDLAPLQEVDGLLGEIEAAWRQIAPQGA
ncbi:flagellar export chaperone FliS [Pseudoxanthomonas winnipegensis]|uniref:Flagellar secretion chaperone FliS n=1 Tax=Pseudoxanthomonas winnipegensis TaxID=2480810 RepID=A0A4Q8LPR9_9GAMM|nr:flagellar export chaperone FliS [Pseudoxanthomonas winnipegensis]RZZ89306.1 flagellar export chaperone FliS [Pseudoxanthomonas winnipegensis]TAA33248.1 flagellar export chaperone FliS [Pseudoxanthomonas winnipegensis]TBV72768.1 flagellar export chaperone FliS [Pseudoxanthomonas winnipegensis]